MKIGLFFGSFNPVHNGHMMIANYMLEFTDINKLWFVVSPHNPLKEKSTLLADRHRYRLLEEAIKDNEKYKVSDIEFRLTFPSYTINTLVHLSEKYPDKKFVPIIGSDNLQNLKKWKNYEMILKNYGFWVYRRRGFENSEFDNHPNVQFVDAPQIEISSTFIRNAIKDKKDIQYFLPEGSYKYLKEMHFYEK